MVQNFVSRQGVIMIFANSTASVQVSRIENGSKQIFTDSLAVEEPLEMRLDYQDSPQSRKQKSISITMRTPGHDLDLAVGFLVTEGILNPHLSPQEQLQSVQHCGPAQAHLGHSNVVKIVLGDKVPVGLFSLERNFYTTSSCGVCGKASIEALRLKSGADLAKLHGDKCKIAAGLIPRLPEVLREAQDLFSTTGGLHASGLFNAKGELEILREDVGRHNALDKVIGWAFQAGRLPLKNSILVLSGRISFELVQKAAMAGLPVIVAVGAPSSLALQLAEEADITLIGFTRGERFNVYCGESRLA